MNDYMANVYKIRKPIDNGMSLGESIEKMKSLAQGIDEYHIVNPNSQVILNLTDIVRILKRLEVPMLMGEVKD